MKKLSNKIKTGFALCGIVIATSFTLAPITNNYYYGEFRVKKVLTLYDSITKPVNYMAFSNLYPDTVNQPSSWLAENQGQVSFNNIPLQYDNIIRTYRDTLERKTDEGINWSYSALDGTGFSQSCTDSFPGYSNINSFPDSLVKSNGFSVSLDSIIYADEIEITMYDGQFRTFVPFYRRVPASNHIIAIPATDLSSLTGPSVSVVISLIKNEFRLINGRKYKFEVRFDVVKTIPLTQ